MAGLIVYLLFLVLVSHAKGYSLIDVLQQYSELSTFARYVNSSVSLRTLISSANNVTLFAPSNDAFETWLSTQSPSLRDEGNDALEAVLRYHLVHGQFSALSISRQSQFAASFLANSLYANVTGGQRVELVTDGNGNPQIVSGNKTVTGITTKNFVFNGGIVQILNSVLTMPLSYTELIAQPNFRFVVEIISAGGYLSAANTGLVDDILYRPDMTFFAPNTQATLDAFKILSANMTQDQLATLFKYHAVPNFLGYSSSLRDGMQLPTLEGRNVTITIRSNKTFVNGAKITSSNYLVQNGVVHMIDGQLDPLNTTGPPPPTTTQTIKPTWTFGNKAAAGIGLALVAVGLVGCLYVFIQWLKRRSREPPMLKITSPVSDWDAQVENLSRMQAQEIGGNYRRSYTRHFSMWRDETGMPAVELDGRNVRR